MPCAICGSEAHGWERGRLDVRGPVQHPQAQPPSCLVCLQRRTSSSCTPCESPSIATTWPRGPPSSCPSAGCGQQWPWTSTMSTTACTGPTWPWTSSRCVLPGLLVGALPCDCWVLVNLFQSVLRRWVFEVLSFISGPMDDTFQFSVLVFSFPAYLCPCRENKGSPQICILACKWGLPFPAGKILGLSM